MFVDDDEDLYRSLERTRKVALKKQEAEASSPRAIALHAISTLPSQIADVQNPEIKVTTKQTCIHRDGRVCSAINLAEGIFFIIICSFVL